MPEMGDKKLEAMRLLTEAYAEPLGWKIEKCLGSGGSAAVFRATKGDNSVAIKVYDPSFFSGDGGAAERHRIDLQRSLIGHHCATLVKILQIDYAHDTCFIQMEYVPWKDLSKCLNEVPSKAIYPLLGQLVDAAKYLDSVGLVHRDIKPANILVSTDFSQLKLIDLGVVRETSDVEDRVDGTDHGQRRPFIATNQYSSPEYLFRTTPPSKRLWHALTLYQVGGVLHDLIMQRPLFAEEVATDNRYAVALAVQSKTPNLDGPGDIPPELKKLAAHCLCKDPDLRTRLVGWDDFFPAKKGDIPALRRKLEKLQETRQKQAATQQQVFQQELLRQDTMRRVIGALRERVLERFPGSTVEPVAGPDPLSQGILRFHLPSGAWAVDMSFEVHWPLPENPAAEIDVVASGVLVRTQHVCGFHPDCQTVTILSNDGGGVDIAVDALVDRFSRFLEIAVDFLETQIEPEKEKIILSF